MTALAEEFDYVVVGAGSAGCVVAARLSESGAHSVALLEAGGEADSFWIRAPLGYGKLHDDPRYNWLYESEPEPELGSARIFLPRGKVLGGTGALTGNVYTRGQREDFDQWRQLGNVGWSYDDVLPFFKRAEDNERGANDYHGAGGPVRVSDPPRHELADAFIEAGIQAGYPRNRDFNSVTDEGFGYNQLTTRSGRRCSSADAYLRPARHRSNLRVITDALATRIVFENREAVGIEFKQGTAARGIRARREIILAAGSFNSPQLLQLSGVGPGDLLRSLSIPVVADLPGVGENLQDHFGPAATYRCTRPVTVNDTVNQPLRRLAMGLDYLVFRRGLMTTNASFAGGCIRTDPALSSSDVRLKIALWARSALGRSKKNMGLLPFSSFSILMALQHPESRGTVRIRSADSSVPPAIGFNFFVSERDRETCVKGLRIIRRIMSMPAIAPYVAEELAPGSQCQTDFDLIDYCRNYGRSSYHSAGSCKMGMDDNAVVDARLRVRGVRRLRVMDASIMPRIVGSNPNAAIVMIGEKGAAMALEDASAAGEALASAAAQ